MAGCWLGIDVVGSVDGLGVGQALQEAGQALAIKSLSHISDRSAQKTSSWTPSQSGTGDGLAVGEPVVGEDVGCRVGQGVVGTLVGTVVGHASHVAGQRYATPRLLHESIRSGQK